MESEGRPNMQFIAENLLQGRGHAMSLIDESSDNTITLGWETNSLNTFLANKFYKGISDSWKAIINNTLLSGHKITRYMANQYKTDITISSRTYRNYVYIPGFNELYNQTTEMTGSNLNIEKQATINNFESKSCYAVKALKRYNRDINGTVTQNITYISDGLIKFKNFIVPNTSTIYAIKPLDGTVDDANIDPFEESGLTNQIKPGDIWLRQDFKRVDYYITTQPEAYIFVSTEQINISNPPVAKECKIGVNLVGGWVKAIAWPIRTPRTDYNQGINYAPFKIDETGKIDSENTRTVSTNVSGICIALSL